MVKIAIIALLAVVHITTAIRKHREKEARKKEIDRILREITKEK